MEQNENQTEVFSKPRRSFRLRTVDDPRDRNPWPRWATIPSRSLMCAIEIAAAAYIGWYMNKREERNERAPAVIALGGVVFTIVMDAFITIASILGYYEATGVCFSGAIDFIPAPVCLVGALDLGWPQNVPDDPWRDAQFISATLAAIVSALHFLSGIGGTIGCCIICRRPAKKTVWRVPGRVQDDISLSSLPPSNRAQAPQEANQSQV
ncbi:hypothetical protein C7999DRAFT_33437 [Corynascus novoguineensis]|uniref:Uncharacterized protein n=1 Tax=Corynascus novoguineensis TaxID=1126955 RepID=A0AAN7CPV1_9PEZI|nr:hypothetical protein C7999DRAFT_33437 [Corynascus novoguineensis]